MIYLRGEGKPIHPDEVADEDERSDAWYLKQLQAYKDTYELSVDQMPLCIRDRLLKRLK